MKIIVVGLGVQGNKRKKFARKDFVGSVDPKNKKANFKTIKEVPLESYDAALLCVPDNQKRKILEFCLKNKKHVLLEKPLSLNESNLKKIQKKANKQNIIFYTAYNHRFEPHLKKIKDIINSKKLGKIYSCRIFYGNGTAKLVYKTWRDRKKGVISDIGSHLLDICLFLFGKKAYDFKFKLNSFHSFENISPDHAVISSDNKDIYTELEMTYCMWKNHFSFDLIAKNGSVHIDSLCKWGPSTLTYRKRIFPSGKPKEYKIVLRKSDPTWALEYKKFKQLIKNKKKTNFFNDLWIQKQINHIKKKST